MQISYKLALILSTLASFGLLAGAFWFEIIVGLPPCNLCIWQRWPHAIIIAIAGIGLVAIKQNWMLLLIALSAISTALIGLYHSGVEQGWWSGPSGCSNQLNSDTDISSLTTSLLEMPVVKCDEIAWSLMGISMAGWNSIASFAIAVFACLCWKKLTQTH
ncbi:MAG: disulfide bond formation protein B [Alphaproteobacteria bacterium]|nr:disulfide bond formation protein B [Alphaproteobacteria bacterium]